jgi:hypothetical protein
MNKATLFLKPVILFTLLFTLILLSGCASTQVEKDTDWEPWVGELTGMVNADLKMFFSRFEEEKDVYSVKGNFDGDIQDFSGGYSSGTMKGKIKGKVKDGICDVRLYGTATVSEGSVMIDGKMIGTLSKTQAFGTWNIVARDDETYEFSGEWSAKKIDSESK